MKNRFDPSASPARTGALSREDAHPGSAGTDAARIAGIDVDPVRRGLLGTLLTGALLGPLAVALPAQAAPLIEIWTLPSCPCCHGWFAHLKENGFDVRIHDGGNNEARARLGVPEQYGSCHTGLVGGYAIEGHVPARELHRLLGERPEAIGLTVPTMPIGSPGMDGPVYGGLSEPYEVLLIKRDGSTSVYASYG